MARAYVILCAELEKKYIWGEDYGVVCWYHDEYTIECREEIAEDVKKISEEAIRLAGEYYNIKCPHEGQGAIGKNWYEIH
jgi:DNA polymerase I-like protein with 3'-5' exonuclease and polymerase domains